MGSVHQHLFASSSFFVASVPKGQTRKCHVCHVNLDLKNTSLYCLACSCNSVRDKAHLSLSIISMTGLRDDAAPPLLPFWNPFSPGHLAKYSTSILVRSACLALAAQAGSPRSHLFCFRSLPLSFDIRFRAYCSFITYAPIPRVCACLSACAATAPSVACAC